jgi:tRNA threonylcarbamoyladenosine modification (KEOPS) complex Cgi121 subunit
VVMTEENLVLEILKQIQNDIKSLRKELREGLSEMNHHGLRIDQEILLLRGDNQAIKDRLDRIEHRLELVE